MWPPGVYSSTLLTYVLRHHFGLNLESGARADLCMHKPLPTPERLCARGRARRPGHCSGTAYLPTCVVVSSPSAPSSLVLPSTRHAAACRRTVRSHACCVCPRLRHTCAHRTPMTTRSRRCHPTHLSNHHPTHLPKSAHPIPRPHAEACRAALALARSWWPRSSTRPSQLCCDV